jgi:poly(A) polymerase
MTSLAPLLDSAPFARTLQLVGEQAARLGLDAYLVGGAVRDLILGRPTTDLDFVTVGTGSGERLARAVAKEAGGKASVYPAFGTAAVHARGLDGALEFVTARKESYRSGSRKPEVEAGTLEDDLARRDFTVNALAASILPSRWGALEDRFGGLRDLNAGLLRTPLDPVATFDDDPLRMVRAARFAAQLGFQITVDALEAMEERAERIGIVAPERITDELQKIIASRAPDEGFRLLYETTVLDHILPELTDLAGVEAVYGIGHKDNLEHSLQVLANLVARTPERSADHTRWLRWAALLHDIGKTPTKRFSPGQGWTFHNHPEVGARMAGKLFRRLALPAGEPLAYVRHLIRLHHRPHALVDEDVTDSAVRRLLFDAGEHVDDLMTLVRADLTTKNPKRMRRYLSGFDRVEEKMVTVEEKDRVRTFQPPVDGNEIMEALGVGEGLAVGLLKERIKEAILDGEVANEHDAAYAFMLGHVDEALRRGRLFDTLVKGLPPQLRPGLGRVRRLLAESADLPADDAQAQAWLEEQARAYVEQGEEESA